MKIADLFARLGVEVDSAAFKNADKLLGRTRDGLMFMAKAAAAAATAIAGTVVAVANHADEVGATAEKIGVNAQRFQELGFAAQQSDTDIGTLTMGLGLLSKTLFAAQEGSEEATKSFKEIGLDPKKFKTADQALVAIAEKISKMPAGAKKTALAMKFFGKSGKELVPLLNIGAEGIAKFAKEANDLGLIMSDAGLQAGSDFGDSLNKIKRAAGGLLQSAILPMLPALTKVMDQFTAWVMVNKELITSKIAGWVQNLTDLLTTLGHVVSWVSHNFGTVLAAAVSVAAVNAFRALTVAMAAAKVQGIAGAVAVGAAWLATILPIIAIGAAIFLLILVIQDLYTWITGGNSFIDKYLWQPFKNFVKDSIAYLGELKDAILDTFKDALGFNWEKDEVEMTREGVYAQDVKRRKERAGNFDWVAEDWAAAPTVQEFTGARPPGSKGAAAGSTTANNMTANITVTSPNPEEAGKAARREIENFWAREMRGAWGAG